MTTVEMKEKVSGMFKEQCEDYLIREMKSLSDLLEGGHISNSDLIKRMCFIDEIAAKTNRLAKGTEYEDTFSILSSMILDLYDEVKAGSISFACIVSSLKEHILTVKRIIDIYNI